MTDQHFPARSPVLELMRLMTDVAALKPDPVAQRQRLIDGLQHQFNTKLGWFMVADDWRPDRRVVMLHQVLTSNCLPRWMQYIGDFTVNHPLEADFYAYTSVRSDDLTQVLRRSEIVTTAAHREQFASCLKFVEHLEVNADAVAAYRTGPDYDRVVAFSLHRDVTAPDFTADEKQLIRTAIEEIRELERRGHIEFRSPVETDLAPRLQQVLERLLSGKSPKEIAGELTLSVHTVREHMQRLYQRYGVSTREDLTAKFLK